MKVKYRKKFLTDLAKIPSTDRKAIEKFAFEEVPTLNSIGESGRIERLKGYKVLLQGSVWVLPRRPDIQRWRSEF